MRQTTPFLALVVCGQIGFAQPGLAYSDDWTQTVVSHVAKTQVALEECSNLKAGFVRDEMPKSTGLSAEEFQQRVAAALPAVRKKLMQDTGLPLYPGALLCKVALKIYGPGGDVPGFLEER